MLGQVHFDGLNQIEGAITAAIAAHGVTETTTIEIVAGGVRGSAQNALIAKTQAKPTGGRWRRNPFYLSQRTKERLRFLARGMTSNEPSTRRRTADDIGNVVLQGVYENVEGQRNPDKSKFTKLTPAYAAYKRRKFGFVTPILRASGDLLGGLAVRVQSTR